MDPQVLPGLAVVALAAVGIWFWLQKRKEPKPSKPGYAPSQELFDQTVANYLSMGRTEMISQWQQFMGGQTPPNLGAGLTDEQIANELAALKLGGRPAT